MKRFLLLSVLLISALHMGAQNVSYIDSGGREKACKSGTYNVVTDQVELITGWYVVNSDVTFDDRIIISGTVHLILTDGHTLTAKKGIYLKEENDLYIYGQSKGTGTLTATGGVYQAGIGGNIHDTAGKVVINGGIVDVIGGYNAAGIGGGAQGNWAGTYGSGGTVIINGGQVTARGNDAGSGIGGGGGGNGTNAIPGSGGTVIINGGQVAAHGGNLGGYGIGPGVSSKDRKLVGKQGTLQLGWRRKSDRIYISDVKATVTLNSEFINLATQAKVTAANVAGFTLAPVGAMDAIEESEVTIIEAIKSTGEQYFNTNYTHKANTIVELDCEVEQDQTYDWEALLGSRLGDFKTNAFCFFSRADSNDIPCFNRSGSQRRGDGFVYGERILLKCEGTTATWYRNSDLNTVAGSVTCTGTSDDGKTPLFLFNLNTSSKAGGIQADGSPSFMAFYGCKIYEGGLLVRDFVPAIYKDVIGIYDRVGMTFGGSGTETPFERVRWIPQLKGDVNDDKHVDINDVVALINVMAGNAHWRYADVNGDYEADINDVVSVVNIMASGEVELDDGTDAAVKLGLCPDENHPHAINIGNDVKYACCNVGAEVPWEFGYYLQWGELSENGDYLWNDYLSGKGTLFEPNDDIGHNIAGTQYDAAQVLWGKTWQMPTKDQLTFLCEKCKAQWITIKGVRGVKYTGPNGGAIFLPAAGYKSGWENEGAYEVGTTGQYSSSEIPSYEPNTSPYQAYLDLEDNSTTYIRSRCAGLTIRPINTFKY